MLPNLSFMAIRPFPEGDVPSLRWWCEPISAEGPDRIGPSRIPLTEDDGRAVWSRGRMGDADGSTDGLPFIREEGEDLTLELKALFLVGGAIDDVLLCGHATLPETGLALGSGTAI